MDQKWIQVLVILMLFQKASSGAVKTVKDREKVEITCHPGPGNMIVWFRVLDGHSVEFIGSYSLNGVIKTTGPSYSRFSYNPNTLTVKSFDRGLDSGTYCCAALVKGIELRFGNITRLSGEIMKSPIPVQPTQATLQKNPSTTTTACYCPENQKQPGATSASMSCHPIMLGGLAGGCGLLLLLLIVTTLYCNRIRTRRCPHHYKRKPRMAALEKQQHI
ncbi:T-cell surface glycoprotein CD8 alpha chain isoform X2 [Parambassis ranga]|uniref:T-cell surface glycoprotein CD8 alpha chain isoform X2 n=1 Tax=Parambassis ranga TaxID=210632 RepID=A0A6P7I602_9TELE|nr:uncharacterized protein LOC114435659 isoform X2 [Parambassis ranga]